MKPSSHTLNDCFQALLVFAALTALAGCVPVETTPVNRPTLSEVRSEGVRGPTAEDTRLRAGEIEAEVSQVDRARKEISVVTPDGRREILPYDLDHTRVTYHGRDYTIDDLESGDRIAYRLMPTGRRYVEIIRIEEPVQARADSRYARSAPPRARTDVIDGTVERIDPNLGVFDIRPRDGRTITVSLPYNARRADVDSFRSLRRGDPVRVEGEFVSPDNFQLLSFLWSR